MGDPARTSTIGPIKVGVLDVSSPQAGLAAMGGGQGQSTLAVKDIVAALIRYYNGHHGIAGRRIQLVEYTVDPTSNSYETELQAACAKFTQDNHVDVVITLTGIFLSESFLTCLANAHTPSIGGTAGAGLDRQDHAKFSTYFSANGVTVERRITALLTGLASQGLLSPASKVGVIVDSCPYTQRAYNATFEPLARKIGFSFIRRDVDCITGFGGIGTSGSQAASYVLPFRQAGVDNVIFVSNTETFLLLGFANAAQRQAYSPWYDLSSIAGPNALGAGYPNEVLPRLRGIGWLPQNDISADVETSSQTRRCRTILASEQVTGQRPDHPIMDVACDAFFLLEGGLNRLQTLSRESLVSSIETLGRAYVSTTALTGATYYDREHHDGPTLFSLFAYRSACSCFGYASKPEPSA